jgi:putative heme iron utilization protein
MKQSHYTQKNKKRREPLYDTEIPTPSHAERARTLVANVGTGTLCTAAREPEGHPYGSFVAYGLCDGKPVFLVSHLAEHTRNLLQDPRASLLVAEPGTGDPLARGRVTLVGQCVQVGEDGLAAAREAYLASHPGASYYIDFKDFSLWNLEIESIRYIGGYGRMSWVECGDWQGAEADPIALMAPRIIEHMNDDHEEAMRVMCLAFSKASSFETVKMTGIDQYGFEMSVRTEQGPRPIRLAFEQAIVDGKQAREQLVSKTKAARAQLEAANA